MPFTGGETVPRRLRGSSAIAASLVVAVFVCVQSSGAAVSSRGTPLDDPKPADSGTKAPKSKPPICPASRAADPGYKFTQPFHGGRSPLGDACGTSHDDSMKIVDSPTGGTQVWAGPGNDNVDAKNGKIDEIWGGADNNSATIDWCLPNGKIHDTVHDAPPARVKKVKVKCTDATSKSRRRGDAPIDLPYVEPDVSVHSRSDLGSASHLDPARAVRFELSTPRRTSTGRPSPSPRSST